MKMRTRRDGFTLLEILIVVAIIVIIAGAVAYNVMGGASEAKKGLAQAQIKGALSSALDEYKLAIGAYPTTEQGLKALVEKPGDLPENKAAKWRSFVKPDTELTDPWGNEYQYKCPGENNTDGYDLSSAGENGNHGDDDDIVNWKK